MQSGGYKTQVSVSRVPYRQMGDLERGKEEGGNEGRKREIIDLSRRHASSATSLLSSTREDELDSSE